MKLLKQKKITAIILAVLMMTVLAFAGCAQSSDTSEEAAGGSGTDQSASVSESAGSSDQDAAAAGEDLLSGKVNIEIVIKDHGTITAELDADAAPITVSNFVNLANEGFYNGLTFHRIIDGFMMQGGDPSGNGSGGADETIKGEFTKNGVENSLSHTRGAISMARAQDYDSASSQFFIVHEDSTFLDGEYAAFGYVTDGMDIVDDICKNTPVQDDNGTVLAEDQPVIETITVVAD